MVASLVYIAELKSKIWIRTFSVKLQNLLVFFYKIRNKTNFDAAKMIYFASCTWY